MLFFGNNNKETIKKFEFKTNRNPVIVTINVISKNPDEILIYGYDSDIVEKTNTFYFYRNKKVDIPCSIYHKIKLPISPENLIVEIVSLYGNSIEAYVSVSKMPPIKKDLNSKAEEWLEFALEFSEKAGYLPTGTYKSKNENFTINYAPYCYDEVYDLKTNKFVSKKLTTPAFIYSKSKIICMAKEYIKNYTIPSRFALLCHEFSHGYLNEKIGLPDYYESGADINGLYIYLGVGFSPFEYLKSFLYVFSNARTNSNHKRYKIMENFVEVFNEEFNKKDFVFTLKI